MTALYLYDEKPINIEKNALALREGLGIQTLSSLDSRCYYLSNLAEAKDMSQNIVTQLQHLDGKALCQKYALPAIALERMMYHDLLVQIIPCLDLYKRICDYLDRHSMTVIHYLGGGWKTDVLAAICTHRGIQLIHRSSWRSRLRDFAASVKHWGVHIQWQWRAADKVDDSADFIFFMPADRFARGLPAVIEALEKTHRVQMLTEQTAKHLGKRNIASLFSFTTRQRFSVNGVLDGLQIKSRWKAESDDVLAWVLKRLVVQTLQEQLYTASCVARVLERCPKAVVVASFVGESLLEVARAMNKKTVVIQTCGTVEYKVHLAGDSVYMLASEQDKHHIVDTYPIPSVKICGHVGYDIKAPMMDAEKALLREQLSVSKQDKLLVFIGSYASPGLIEWESIAERSKYFLQAASTLEHVRIVLKLHPYEHHLAAYHDMVKKLDMEQYVMVTQHMDIGNLVQVSDAVVMLESTVGQESIVWGKPLLDIPVLEDWFGYHRSGAALVAYHIEDIREKLNRILYDETTQKALCAGRKRYVNTYFPKQDGQVVARICHHLRCLQ